MLRYYTPQKKTLQQGRAPIGKILRIVSFSHLPEWCPVRLETICLVDAVDPDDGYFPIDDLLC